MTNAVSRYPVRLKVHILLQHVPTASSSKTVVTHIFQPKAIEYPHAAQTVVINGHLDDNRTSD